MEISDDDADVLAGLLKDYRRLMELEGDMESVIEEIDAFIARTGLRTM